LDRSRKRAFNPVATNKRRYDGTNTSIPHNPKRDYEMCGGVFIPELKGVWKLMVEILSILFSYNYFEYIFSIFFAANCVTLLNLFEIF
jgi:hypothetical protein